MVQIKTQQDLGESQPWSLAKPIVTSKLHFSGSGIFDNLSQFQLPYPEAIFDIDYFRTTRPGQELFTKLVKKIN